MNQSTQTVANQVTNIVTVLDVIRGIVDQTHLLALYVTIEATRARSWFLSCLVDENNKSVNVASTCCNAVEEEYQKLNTLVSQFTL